MYFEYYCENCEDVFYFAFARDSAVRCPECLQWEAYINEDYENDNVKEMQ